jgi:hypothetical protein
MSSYSFISHAVSHIFPKWLATPDVDDTGEACSVSSCPLGQNEPGDESGPGTHKWPSPGPHPAHGGPASGEMFMQGCVATKNIRSHRRQRRPSRL